MLAENNSRRPLHLQVGIPGSHRGHHATHGIVKQAMPSETWQVAFSPVVSQFEFRLSTLM